MTSTDSTRWVHRPARGPVAWGAAVLAVTTVPGLTFLSLVVLDAVVEDSRVVVVLAPLVWMAVGGLVALSRQRIVRGIGIGLLAGGVPAAVLALLVSYGGGSL